MATQASQTILKGAVGTINTTSNVSDRKIVSFQNDSAFASIKEIYKSESGTNVYRYKLKTLVDYFNASTFDSFQLKLHVSRDGTVGTNITSDINNIIDPSTTADDLVELFLFLFAKSASATADQRKAILATYKVDLSSYLDKPLLNVLKAGSILRGVVSFDKKKVIETYRVGDLSNSGIGVPNIETNVYTDVSNELYTNPDTYLQSNELQRVYAHNLMFDLLQDPAILGQRTYNLINANNASKGTIALRPEYKINNPYYKLLQQQLLEITSEAKKANSPLTENDLVSVPVIRENRLKEITLEVDIPEELIGVTDFSLIFETIDSSGRTTQLTPMFIRHSYLNNIKNTPFIPPKVDSFLVSGKPTLRIKQMDPVGTNVIIYKKTLLRNEVNTSSGYSYVANVPVLYGSGFVTFTDQTSIGSNPVLYRVLAATGNNAIDQGFASTIVESNQKNIANGNDISRLPYYCNIYSKLNRESNGTLNVYVSDVPPQVVAIDLLRKDLSMRSNDYTTVESNRRISNSNTSIPYIFTDMGLVNGRDYAYSVSFTFSNGIKKTSSKKHVMRYLNVTQNIVDTIISPPIVQPTDNNGYDVKFTITKNYIKEYQNKFQKMLFDQGYESSFINDIIANKSRLGYVLATTVFRTNKSTSEVEYFGVVDSNNFSDASVGGPLGIKPVVPGNKYEYTILTYGRLPESINDTAKQTLVNAATGQSYTYAPAKWSHPIVLNNGILPWQNNPQNTNDAFLQYFASNPFSFGDILDIDTVEVSVPDMSPTLSNAKATYLTENVVGLEWKVNGNKDKIDHYIISLQVNGQSKIISSVHNFFPNSTCYFFDQLTDGECGNLIYYITAKYFDGEEGTTITTNNLVISR